MDWGLVAEIFLLCVIGGVIAGFGAGLFGLGGGTTTVPILNYLLPLAGVAHTAMMHAALAASLVLIVVNTSAAALKRWRSDELDLHLLGRLLPPLALGAVIGTVLADFVNTLVLSLFFLLIVLNSIRVCIQGLIAQSRGGGQQTGDAPLRPTTAGLMAAMNGLAGALGGIGAGTIMVPFLSRHGLDMKHAGGQAAGLSIVIGLIGSVGYAVIGLNEVGMPPGSIGYLYLPAVAGLALGGLVTSPYAVRLSHRMDELLLKRLFLAALLVILLAMVLKMVGIT